MTTVTRSEISPLAIRQNNARVRLVDSLVTIGKLDAADAEKVAAFYLKEKFAKLDAVTGQFSVKHGRFLDVEVIHNCLAECNTDAAKAA